jgi:hypothetical protein
MVLGLLAIAGLTRWSFGELWATVTPLVALLVVAVIWVWRRVRRVGASAS